MRNALSRGPTRTAKLFLVAGLLGALLAALAASALGGATGPTGWDANVLAKAKRDVAKYRRPLKTFTGPKTSPGRIPKGKSVYTITCGNAAPLCLRAGKSVIEAAKAIGWTGKVLDGKNNPQTWASAVNTALTSKASAIVMNSSQPSLVPSQIAKARNRGVPVMGTLTCNPPQKGLIHQYESDRFKTGYALAQWVIVHAPNGGEVLVLRSPEFRCLQKATRGFEAGIKSYPKLKIVETVTSPISDTFGPSGGQKLAAVFRRHPRAKFVWVMSESWAGMYQQAVQASGRRDVTGLGIDGDFFVPAVRGGARFVMAGPDTEMYGWWVVDGLIRYFNKKPQLKENIPFRIIDRANAKTNPGKAIKASYNFRARFKRLWAIR